MVWGGLHLNGTTPLYIIQGFLTGVRYRDEIVSPLIQPALQAMGKGATLQHDNVCPALLFFRVVQTAILCWVLLQPCLGNTGGKVAVFHSDW